MICLKRKKPFSGFTLVEILVTIGILSVIVVVASNLFFSLLKGSLKTKTLQNVKQNGTYAISVMERTIRNARRIESFSGSTVQILNPDGGKTTFSCEDISPPDGKMEIASNSSRLISSEVKVDNCSSVFDVTLGEPGARPDTVVIKFTLTQAVLANRPEEEAAVTFQTTVSLRNY